MNKAMRSVRHILMVAALGLWTGSAMAIPNRPNIINDYSINPDNRYDFFANPPTPGQNAMGTCIGMPDWGVTEPYCNLWVKDMPLGYQPARGPGVALQLAYKMRDDGAGYSANEFSFGKGWNCDWRSFVQIGSDGTNLYLPGGGVVPITNTVEFHSYTILTNPAANVFWLLQKDGSTNIYSFAATIDFTNRYYLTAISDSFGQKLTLQYATNSNVARLLCLIDADGRTNSLTYTNAGSNTNLVVAVTDGYGRTARMGYNSSWQLTGISDVVSNASSFAYDSTGWMTNLTTPYGTTTFAAQQGTNWGNPTNGFYRWLHVQDAGGGNHLWVYRSDLRGVLSNPPYQTLDSANSFYWGPRQYRLLSNSTNLLNLTDSDYRQARRKNWDRTCYVEIGCDQVGLMFEWEFSPDGSNAGQRTDYLYEGQAQPRAVLRYLSNGDEWFDETGRNQWGHVDYEVRPFVTQSGSVQVVRIPNYSDDGLDLLQDYDFLHNRTVAIGYEHHLPVAVTNAINEVTRYTRNVFGQLVSVTYPGGVLTTTNYYFTDGPSVGRLQSTIDYTNGVAVRQNSFTYVDGRLFTHTDERGNVTSNYWDALGRPTGLSDGQGSLTNLFDRLDLVCVVDRMQHTNTFAFDAMRRMTNRTDALGRRTVFEYCPCGALEAVTEAVGTPNQRTLNFGFDNAGRHVRTDLPGGLWETAGLDSLGRVVATTNSAGLTLGLAYNVQGLVYAVSNSLGRISYAEFDAEDHILLSTDANNVTVHNTFDYLGRLTSTGTDYTYLDYGYTANVAGPTSITDALSHQTHIGYDAYGRKLAETNANSEITRYTYEPDGALKSLTDGNNHTRTWNYNQYGWLSNKLDGLGHEVERYGYNANGWVTSKWTPEKDTASFAFDKVGNLLTNTAPGLTNIFAFDELNRMTNMVDAIGTNAFAWSPNDQLLSETGPWPYSAVTNGYTQGLRTALGIGTNWVQSYTFEAGGRMTSITSPAGLFRYNYGFQPASSLVTGIRLPNSAYITNLFDGMARLTNTALVNFWGHTLDGYGYTLNEVGLRTGIRRDLGLTNNLATAGYDNIGQVTSWIAKEGNGSIYRAQEQLSFAYDAAHNLYQRVNGELTQTFTADAADQLNSVTRSGKFTLAGATPAPATSVTVNGQTAARYGDLTFAATNLTLLDGANSFTNIAQNTYGVKATNILAVNYPETVTLGWDQNGSLTNDGSKQMFYDSANQLTNVTLPGKFKKEFVYDGLNRLRIKRDFSWNGSTWSPTNETRFLWDGNVIVQLRDSNNVPTLTLTRGLDLSGTLQGAEGTGGLLAMTDGSGASYFYHSDGNGNVTALMDSQENIVARRLYGPFGNSLSLSGSKAGLNPFWYSSQLHDEDTDCYFYKYRVYVPSLQRWLNQDPIQEHGGINLYCFVANSPITYIDPNGHILKTLAKEGSQEYKDYQETLDYLKTSETGKRIIEHLESSKNVYYVALQDNLMSSKTCGMYRDSYLDKSRIIMWVPRMSFRWKLHNEKEWKRSSPALLLMHELGHAYHHDVDESQFENDLAKTEGPGLDYGIWSNEEERITIQAVENTVAKELGIANYERTWHDPTKATKVKEDYITTGPTSVDPLPENQVKIVPIPK